MLILASWFTVWHLGISMFYHGYLKMALQLKGFTKLGTMLAPLGVSWWL